MGGEMEIAVILQGGLPHLRLIGLHPQEHVREVRALPPKGGDFLDLILGFRQGG